jgi:hypothetical protein
MLYKKQEAIPMLQKNLKVNCGQGRTRRRLHILVGTNDSWRVRRTIGEYVCLVTDLLSRHNRLPKHSNAVN